MAQLHLLGYPKYNRLGEIVWMMQFYDGWQSISEFGSLSE